MPLTTRLRRPVKPRAPWRKVASPADCAPRIDVIRSIVCSNSPTRFFRTRAESRTSSPKLPHQNTVAADGVSDRGPRGAMPARSDVRASRAVQQAATVAAVEPRTAQANSARATLTTQPACCTNLLPHGVERPSTRVHGRRALVSSLNFTLAPRASATAMWPASCAASAAMRAIAKRSSASRGVDMPTDVAKNP